MLEWEQYLIEHQASHNEIYERYIDDIFMTTNQTKDGINEEIEKANIDTSVDFLDVTITNEYPQLTTSIFHKQATEPYILPYTSDHSSHIHRNIPYTALLRAARICPNAHDFNSERIRTDVSLLLNGYPPNFISIQFYRFFYINNAVLVLKHLNEQVYHHLHGTLLYQPTRREKQLQLMMQDPLRYLFDSGLTLNLPKEFYQWWKTYYAFDGSPIHDVKVRLVTNTNRTL